MRKCTGARQGNVQGMYGCCWHDMMTLLNHSYYGTSNQRMPTIPELNLYIYRLNKHPCLGCVSGTPTEHGHHSYNSAQARSPTRHACTRPPPDLTSLHRVSASGLQASKLQPACNRGQMKP